jgi:4-amino-4-deoxy-L-arabinose transferase-like glycosyltransferase
VSSPSGSARLARRRLAAADLGRVQKTTLELTALAVFLAAAGVLFSRGLSATADFDESVYLAAVDAIRHGQQLGKEVFTAQPPGFYFLLAGGDALFGNTLTAVRSVVLGLALLACLSAYAVGRAAGGPIAGFGAAGLLAISPSFTGYAPKISADLPSLSLGLASLAFFVRVCDRRARRGRLPFFSAASGALAAASFSVKLSAVLMLVPLVGLAAVRRPRLVDLGWFVVGAAAIVLAIVLATWGEWSGIWHGAVSYHQAARRVPDAGSTISANAHRIAHFLDLRTPFGWLVPTGLVAWFLLVLGRLGVPLWPFWAWTGAVVVALVFQKPLHDNHMVLLAATLAVPAGTALGAVATRLHGRVGLAAMLVLLLAISAGYAQQVRQFSRNAMGEPADFLWAVDQVRDHSRPGQLVVADQPIIAFLAGRRVPGDLVDTAYLRFESGYLTERQVLARIDQGNAAAVVVAREFRERPAILAGLARRFPHRVSRGKVAVYYRS